MNKIGMHFGYWVSNWQTDYVYYVNKVAKLGFDVMEIDTQGLVSLPRQRLYEIKKAYEENGLEITCCTALSKDRDIASPDCSIRENGIEYLKKTLEVVNFMGGKIFAGVIYGAWQAIPEDGIFDKRPYVERSIESIKQIVKTAEDYDIDYCVEAVNRFEQYIINSSEEGIEFVNNVSSPNLKLLLDTFHMNIEEDSLGKAIQSAGDKLGHFHIGDCNRKTPGTGHMPWDEIFDALKQTGYNGRIVMEPFVKTGGEVGRDIKVWRDLSGNADELKLDEAARTALGFVKEKLKR